MRMREPLATVLTWQQARNSGLTADRIRWLVSSGRWQRLHPVYLTHNGAPTRDEQEVAALLYAGKGAALSCCIAAARDGLVGFEDARIHLAVTFRPEGGAAVRNRGAPHLTAWCG